jgi:hypothetical protein
MLQYYSLFAVSPIASIATTVSGQSLFAASPIASTATTVSDHSFFLQSPRLHGHLPRMPTTHLQRPPLLVNTTIQFSELLLQAGVPHDLDAENVCTARLIESI